MMKFHLTFLYFQKLNFILDTESVINKTTITISGVALDFLFGYVSKSR
ncbi:hypothetical protein ACQKMK_09250 [Viridibacillus arvi]